MDATLKSQVERMLEGKCAEVARVSGGDINDAFRVTLLDGRVVFVKTNRHAPASMFRAEAQGLAWLAEAHAVLVPKVLAVSDDPQAPCLVLEYLAASRRQQNFDEQLGLGLAALHRFGAARFGLDHDNFIGSLPQTNGEMEEWPAFYRERRLMPQVAQAAQHLGSGILRRFERLFARMAELVGAAEPPARLHGDLWGGNLHAGNDGAPCLIDPAVYGGHREVDLAMMRLFGGFSERVFDAYREAFPLQAGFEERVPLYQLYPLLVHVNLFGGGYVGSVEQVLRRCG